MTQNTFTPPKNFVEARELLSAKSPFFALMLAEMNIKSMPSGTMAVDGLNLFLGPDAADMKIEETLGVIVHEMMHITNRHHLRIAAYPEWDFESFNEGADIAINPIVIQHGYKLPTDVLLPETLEDYDLSAEELTAKIIARKKKKQEEQENKKKEEEQKEKNKEEKNNKNNKENKNQDKKEEKNEENSEKSQNNKHKSGSVLPFPGTKGDKSAPSHAEIKKEEKRISDLVKKCAQTAKLCGEKTDWQDAEYRIIPAGKNPIWIDEIEGFLSGKSLGDMTWNTLSRRHMALGMLAPGRKRQGLGTPILAIDASASVTVDQISNQVASVLDLFDRCGVEFVRLIVCDEEITKDENIPLADLESALQEIKGNRGTAFSPVFDRILPDTNDDTILIYATDLGVWPSEWDKITDYPKNTLWVTDSRKTAPVGTTIHI